MPNDSIIQLPETFPALESASDVFAALARIYKDDPFEHQGAPFINHVAAVYAPEANHDPAAPYPVLRVSSASPSSPYDKFILNATRARSDLIVVTGAILRDEPTLNGNVMPPFQTPLRDWRTETRSASAASPAVCILTSGKNLNYAHPIFSETIGDVYVYTGAAYVQDLRAQADAPHLRDSDPTTSVAWTTKLERLQQVAGRSTSGSTPSRDVTFIPSTTPSLKSLLTHFAPTFPQISVECGPTTTNKYYQTADEPPTAPRITKIFLSIYSGPLPAPPTEALLIPTLPSPAQLSPNFLAKHYERKSKAKQGPWTFELHTLK